MTSDMSPLGGLQTEQRNPASSDLDLLPIDGILRLLNSEDKGVAVAVEREIPYITRAVEFIVASLRNGGRLFYVGAGTSGRLGIIDASECPPTFGTDPAQIRGIMAGGRDAVFRSKEGAEDNEEAGGTRCGRRGRSRGRCGVWNCCEQENAIRGCSNPAGA